MFKSVLIANRGEIACRVARTCKRLGIRSIAVYSDTDAQSPHVHECDDAVYIGESDSKDSYLNIEAIIEAAKSSGADAIHPGYGFLSENAVFAEAVAKAKITFIGPSPASIVQMGDKVKAKELAAAAKVPTVSGLTIADPKKVDPKAIVKQLGLPLLIKAAGGGGGRGMRIVRVAEELSDAITSASREAESFFGNGDVFIEKLVEGAKHIEVQVMGCSSGEVMHFGTRDCTLQRNHQKVIEEAPAALLPVELREKLHRCAVEICTRAKYENAGTVEFLVKDSEFYFLEVNSRLQVEHPVTELIYGVDLVEIQLRVAAGEKLKSIIKAPLTQNGHAIQARICSESPRRDFQADTGMIVDWQMPETEARVDTGYTAGSVISHYYDSLIAKVIVQSEDRESTIYDLRNALAETVITGVETNIEYLHCLLSDSAFQEGTHHTKSAHTILDEMKKDGDEALPLLIYALYEGKHVVRGDGFRIQGSENFKRSATINGEKVTRTFAFNPENIVRIAEDGKEIAFEILSDNRYLLTCEGHNGLFTVYPCGKTLWITGALGIFSVTPLFPTLRTAQTGGGKDSVEVKSPLPGKILSVSVQKGDLVKDGSVLAVIESMKMEHSIASPGVYTIDTVSAAPGASVQRDQVLFVLKRTV